MVEAALGTLHLSRPLKAADDCGNVNEALEVANFGLKFFFLKFSRNTCGSNVSKASVRLMMRQSKLLLSQIDLMT